MIRMPRLPRAILAISAPVLAAACAAPAPQGQPLSTTGPVRFVGAVAGDWTDYRVRVTGRLAHGVTCPVLAGEDGRTYSLAGSAASRPAGARITVDGYVGRWSGCDYPAVLKVADIDDVPRN